MFSSARRTFRSSVVKYLRVYCINLKVAVTVQHLRTIHIVVRNVISCMITVRWS